MGTKPVSPGNRQMCAKMNDLRQGFQKLSYEGRPAANACVVTSGHVTKMAITPFDPL